MQCPRLTLLEEQMPLIATETERHLSPWRKALRPTRGVLHALYVFRVIQDFFYNPVLLASLTDREREYVLRRIEQIDSEVAGLGDLAGSRDLTMNGRALVERLQAGNQSRPSR